MIPKSGNRFSEKDHAQTKLDHDPDLSLIGSWSAGELARASCCREHGPAHERRHSLCGHQHVKRGRGGAAGEVTFWRKVAGSTASDREARPSPKRRARELRSELRRQACGHACMGQGLDQQEQYAGPDPDTAVTASISLRQSPHSTRPVAASSVCTSARWRCGDLLRSELRL